MTRARGGVASGPIIILAAVLAAVIACGCSRRARFVRHDVQGTVRLEGQPVPAGEVVFEPDAAADIRLVLPPRPSTLDLDAVAP